jgi:aminopeptidase N
VSNLTSGDRSVWHYIQEKPHVSYLVTLIIGKFDIVDLPPPKSIPNLPMRVWAPQGLGDRVLQTYGRTGEMIDLFNDRFGVPYPWDRYDQLCAKNFRSGGMENTTATTMYPTAILDKNALLDGDLDGLISHELCHQWTGDFITCKSWAHIWLNEGWATYGSALWNEQRFGLDGYLDSMRGNFGVARRDRTTGEIAMVSPVYEDPGETFRRPGNPYPKGASILHMLRMMLGDEVFWKGVRLYMNRHALGVAETNDFRYALEEVSGLGLEWFFEQWCYRPGCPELNVKIRYEGDKRELFVDVEQTQKIDAATPAFRFTLPVVVRTPGGEKTLLIDVADKATPYRTTLDGVPSIVAVDPYLHVLKTITEEKPLSMWVEQVKSGPTIAARHAAIEALGKAESAEHVALLSQLVRDEKQRHTLRNAAADALAGYASAEAKDALLSIVRDGVPEARVRANLVDKLRRYDKERVLDLLTDFATNDPSYSTRVEAIGGLAQLKASERVDQIVELATFQSQHDQVRNAALRALCDLDEPRGLDLAIRFSAYGYVDRSRPSAIGSVARLAKHDKDKAVNVLLGLLNDPESRAMSAAGSALADIGDSRAIAPIRSLSESHRDAGIRTRAAEWLKRLEEKQSASGETPPSTGDAPRGRRRSRTTE